MHLPLAFSEDTRNLLLIAESIAKEYYNLEISPSHLLKAILNDSISIRKFLENKGKDVYYIDDWADLRISKCLKGSSIPDLLNYDNNSRAVLEEADLLRIKLGSEKIEPQMVLATLCIPGVGFSFEQLKTLPLSYDEIVNSEIFSNTKNTQSQIKEAHQSESKFKYLSSYCLEKTAAIKNGLFYPIKCRDKEIRMIAETLCRLTKPNAILVGEPGVGKTAIIDGLTKSIIDRKVPDKLLDAKIFELDFGALIAGASYKGEVEDRLKKIIAEVKIFQKAILFIDDIHLMLDKHGGAAGAVNLIKPELAKGGIIIIGATSNDEFAKYIERDEAFLRRFEKIDISEPNEENTFAMLEAIIPKYRSHYNIDITEHSIKEAIKLAKRFNKDRKLPDAAIDLIDKTMSALSIFKQTAHNELDEIINSNKLLTSEKKNQLLNDSSELTKIKSLIANQLNYLLLAKANYSLDDFKSLDNQAQAQLIFDKVQHFKSILNSEISCVEVDDLYSVVSFKTGIALGKLKSSEQDRLLSIEAELKKRVIGQDQAIKEIAQAIKRARAGLRKHNKPVGSFFLVGPTGTGKTELARTLADYLFQDENTMLRFDMSEFTEEASVSLLHGASPGYVGYEEGGLLVNEVRKHPYSVVLFDEIEKAHPSVFKIFFQVLDEGKLHDKLGKEGDFTNSIILFTSNIGSDIIINSFEKDQKLLGENVLKEEMKKYFQPAFINRLDKIIPFAPIRKDVVHLILEIHLNKVRKLLADRLINLDISESAIEKLSLMGYSLEYGARPILGVIRDYIETPLSNMIIAGELKNGSTTKLDINDKGQFIWECIIDDDNFPTLQKLNNSLC